jgi:glutathione synthase/RimK-type ligase-like ATP-grasp enzyme
MKTIHLGYLYSGKILTKQQELFLNKAKNKNLVLTLINISDPLTEDMINTARSCDVIYNDSGEEFAIDYIKEFEKNKIFCVENSKSFEEDENKWKLINKCVENNIPVPETILLSDDLIEVEKQLSRFDNWPVILKRVKGTWGEFVEKANNIEEAINIINKFKSKSTEKIPIIAQEFIDSFSYRVTYIGDKILQTAIKENNNWKCTGVYAKKFKTFIIDSKLEKIIKDLMKVLEINICGVDLLKNQDKWLVIETNAEPALDFFDNEIEMLLENIIDLLIKKVNERNEILKEKEYINRARKIVKILKNKNNLLIIEEDLKKDIIFLMKTNKIKI